MKSIARLPMIARFVCVIPIGFIWMFGFLLTRIIWGVLCAFFFVMKRVARMTRAIPLVLIGFAIWQILNDQALLGALGGLTGIGLFTILGTVISTDNPTPSEEQQRILRIVRKLFREILIHEMGSFTRQLPYDLDQCRVMFTFVCTKTQFFRFKNALNLMGLWIQGTSWEVINPATETTAYRGVIRQASQSELYLAEQQRRERQSRSH